jgi:outer membrane protein TolC
MVQKVERQMTKIMMTLLGSALFLLPQLQAQSSFTLDEAIAYAQSNAMDVKMEKLKIDDAEAQMDEFTAIGLPKINGKVTLSHYFDVPTSIFPDFISPAIYDILFDEDLLVRRDLEKSGGIPVQFGTTNNLDIGIEAQTLLLDGSYFVGLQAQRLYRDLVVKRYNEKVYGVKEAVSQAYLSVLNIDKNIALLNDNIKNLESLYIETKAIYESGFAEKLDADRLRLSLQNLKTKMTNYTRLREVSTYMLKFAMGYPVNEEIVLTESFDDRVKLAMIEDLSKITTINYLDRPEYISMQTAIQLQDLNIKRLRMGYLPSLYGFASYGQQLQRNDLFDSNENDWFKASLVGFNLNVPLFNGMQRKASIQRAKISKENSLMQKSLFEQSLELEFNNAYIQYINAKQLATDAEENLDLAQEIYDITKIKFKEGVGSSLEVSQAESELYTSQSLYTKSLYDLVMTSTKFKATIGKL